MRRCLLAMAMAWLLLAAGAVWAAGFVDDSGQRIEVTRPFKRIISLYGAHTENLFSLGLDREIIGVSPNESYPPAALGKPVFSYRDDPERFLAARPDLVLIRPMIFRGHRALVKRLQEFGIEVVSLQTRTVKQMFAYWRRLGLLTGRQARAEDMIRRFRQGLARLKARVAHIPPSRRPRVFFESIHRKMKTFAPDSMAVFVLEAAGGINLAADAKSVHHSNIASYGKERILALGDKVDVYLAEVGPMNRVTVEEIKNESGFKALKAVREGRIYLVDEKIVSRPTLRLLKGIETIQGYLYPGLEARR